MWSTGRWGAICITFQAVRWASPSSCRWCANRWSVVELPWSYIHGAASPLRRRHFARFKASPCLKWLRLRNISVHFKCYAFRWVGILALEYVTKFTGNLKASCSHNVNIIHWPYQYSSIIIVLTMQFEPKCNGNKKYYSPGKYCHFANICRHAGL